MRLRFVKRGGRDGLLMHFCGEAERTQVQSRPGAYLRGHPSYMTSTLRREGGPRKDVVRESKRSKNPKLDIIRALPLIHFKIPLRNLEQKVAHIISLGDCCDGNVLWGPNPPDICSEG